MPAFCNNSRGVFAFTCFIIASSTRPAASASAWAWWWLNWWPICAVKWIADDLAVPARCVRHRDTWEHYFPVPVPPQVGQVIFPTPEHLGHSFPFTFLVPLHIGHLIVFWPLQDLQVIISPSILFSEALEKAPVANNVIY